MAQVDFQCVPAACDDVTVIEIPARKALNFASDLIITVFFFISANPSLHFDNLKLSVTKLQPC